jgi:regulator of protease activity HflC (stomatin/prohibitin superfamily)
VRLAVLRNTRSFLATKNGVCEVDKAYLLIPVAFLALLALGIATSTVKIAREYERGVVFRLGRLIALKGPGLFFIFPFGIDHLRKVDLRVVTLEVASRWPSRR